MKRTIILRCHFIVIELYHHCIVRLRPQVLEPDSTISNTHCLDIRLDFRTRIILRILLPRDATQSEIMPQYIVCLSVTDGQTENLTVCIVRPSVRDVYVS